MFSYRSYQSAFVVAIIAALIIGVQPSVSAGPVYSTGDLARSTPARALYSTPTPALTRLTAVPRLVADGWTRVCLAGHQPFGFTISPRSA